MTGKKTRFREKVLDSLSSRGTESVGFRMLPMIDVLFLLLIFFLITARFHAPESALSFRLPSPGEIVAGKPEPLDIEISVDQGDVVTKISASDLTATIKLNPAALEEGLTRFTNELSAIMREKKRTAGDPVQFICDDKVEWLYVAKVYNLLYGMGIQDITFGLSE